MGEDTSSCQVNVYALDPEYFYTCKMYPGHTIMHASPAPITSSGATKPECNGLSRFKEDKGGP